MSDAKDTFSSVRFIVFSWMVHPPVGLLLRLPGRGAVGDSILGSVTVLADFGDSSLTALAGWGIHPLRGSQE